MVIEIPLRLGMTIILKKVCHPERSEGSLLEFHIKIYLRDSAQVRNDKTLTTRLNSALLTIRTFSAFSSSFN